MGLDAGKLFEEGARRVSETRALLPHFETLPEHEGEEANEDLGLEEDVGLDSVLALMPDRTQVQLIFLDAKSRFDMPLTLPLIN